MPDCAEMVRHCSIIECALIRFSFQYSFDYEPQMPIEILAFSEKYVVEISVRTSTSSVLEVRFEKKEKCLLGGTPHFFVVASGKDYNL